MGDVKKQSFGARLNSKGLEVLSKVKKAVHIKIRRPVSEHHRFRQYLDQASKQAALAGEDTYEEFINFGPDDEGVMPESSYELVYDPRTGKEVLPEEKMWLDKQMALFEAQEREKRKLQRDALKKKAEQPESDYVTQPKKKNNKKAAIDPQDDDRE